MTQIHLLEDSVINKIAAGEVVERPSSVVKELVENSLDAGATKIELDLELGGKKRITLRDNGFGISREDLPLAFTRHATSKICNEEDLFEVNSMGFRGEALASIASISKFTLCSRQNINDSGWKVDLEGGKGDVKGLPWQGPVGTSISVGDLFFNVPAREKFLKSPTTEYSHCFDLIQSIALSRPDIDLSLSHNGKEKFRVSSVHEHSGAQGDKIFGESVVRARTCDIFGKDLVDKLLYVVETNEFGCFEGLVSPPGVEKPTSRHIVTFVNNRWVKDNTIRYGLLRGYQSHLLKGKFPVAVVYFTCEPSLVDCNVHPAKTELRFQYSGEVQGLLALGVRKAIRECQWAGESSSFENNIPSSVQKHSSSGFRVRETRSSDVYTSTPRTSSSFFENNATKEHHEEKPKPVFVAPTPIISEPKINPHRSVSQDKEVIPWGELQYIGHFAKCYLMFENGERLLILDQHAFHERILFEKLNKDIDLLCTSQRLIVPEIIELSTDSIDYLMKEHSNLSAVGFDYKMISEQAIEVRSVPSILSERCLDSLFEDLADARNQSNEGEITASHLSHYTLSTMACHAAVRAGEELNIQDINILIQDARSVDFYHNCPHGRRVFKWFKKNQVEGWFDR